jgi:hypothetical protein
MRILLRRERQSMIARLRYGGRFLRAWCASSESISVRAQRLVRAFEALALEAEAGGQSEQARRCRQSAQRCAALTK